MKKLQMNETPDQQCVSATDWWIKKMQVR